MELSYDFLMISYNASVVVVRQSVFISEKNNVYYKNALSY
jgi:hypothetical protein